MKAFAKRLSCTFDSKIFRLPNVSGGFESSDGWVGCQNIGDSWFLGMFEFK